PDHLERAEATAGRARRRRFPRAVPGADPDGAEWLSGRPSVPQRARHAGRRSVASDLSPRLERLQRRARRHDRRRLLVRPSFRDPRRGRRDDELSPALQAVAGAAAAARDPGSGGGPRPPPFRSPTAPPPPPPPPAP